MAGPAATNATTDEERAGWPWYLSTGWWCLAIAIVHIATTDVFYGESLGELFSGDLLGALDADPDDPAIRGASFWYAMTGLLLASFGWTTWRDEASGRLPSRGFATGLVTAGTAGCVLSYESGFWLVLGVGVAAAVRRRRAGEQSRASTGDSTRAHGASVEVDRHRHEQRQPRQ